MKTMQLHSLSRMPDCSIEAVEHFWDNHVHDWKVAKSPAGTREFFEEIEVYRYEKLDYLADAIGFERFSGKSVLDLGCGVGNDLARFAKAGAVVTGVDIAEHSISLAKDNFAFRNLKGEFHKMNGESLEFADNQFDAVFCHTVLHFTPNPSAMVAEIHRVLKPGGEAILMTVNRRSWMNFLHKLMKIELDHLDAPVFYNFTIAEFESLLQPFASARIVPHRFPVPTKIHAGLKAKLFNKLFVGTFNKLPRRLVRRTGHHLIAYVTK